MSQHREDRDATRTGRAHDPGEAHRDGVLERSQHRELSRELTKLITAGHEAAESTDRQRESKKCAASQEQWKLQMQRAEKR